MLAGSAPRHQYPAGITSHHHTILHTRLVLLALAPATSSAYSISSWCHDHSCACSSSGSGTVGGLCCGARYGARVYYHGGWCVLKSEEKKVMGIINISLLHYIFNIRSRIKTCQRQLGFYQSPQSKPILSISFNVLHHARLLRPPMGGGGGGGKQSRPRRPIIPWTHVREATSSSC